MGSEYDYAGKQTSSKLGNREVDVGRKGARNSKLDENSRGRVFYVADMAESVHKGRHLSKFPRKAKYTKRLKFTRQITRTRQTIERRQTRRPRWSVTLRLTVDLTARHNRPTRSFLSLDFNSTSRGDGRPVLLFVRRRVVRLPDQ